MIQRVALHLICLVRRPRNFRFHLAGVRREYRELGSRVIDGQARAGSGRPKLGA